MSIDAFPERAASGAGTILGFTQATTNQNVNAGADVTGLTTPVWVKTSGRVLKITCQLVLENMAASLSWGVTSIMEGAVVLNSSVTNHGATAGPDRFDTAYFSAYVFNPTPGMHTYKVNAGLNSGTARTSVEAGPRPGFLVVEDVTGSYPPGYAPGIVTDYLYGLGLSNGTATSFTNFLTQNSIATLPYNYKMVVDARVNTGANGSANIVTLRIEDEAGVQLSPKGVIDGAWRQDNTIGSWASCWGLIAEKNYNAGQTCGFRMSYKVNTSNIFLDGIARVQLVPR